VEAWEILYRQPESRDGLQRTARVQRNFIIKSTTSMAPCRPCKIFLIRRARRSILNSQNPRISGDTSPPGWKLNPMLEATGKRPALRRRSLLRWNRKNTRRTAAITQTIANWPRSKWGKGGVLDTLHPETTASKTSRQKRGRQQTERYRITTRCKIPKCLAVRIPCRCQRCEWTAILGIGRTRVKCAGREAPATAGRMAALLGVRRPLSSVAPTDEMRT
jgi:hypothetical protein